MSKELKIHHNLGGVSVKPCGEIDSARLKKMIRSTLDKYKDEELIPASVVIREEKERYGDYYDTPGYNLRVYRYRADLTQVALAKKAEIRQAHLSEMENNKRPIGKGSARKLGKILKFDYRELL
ncbi:MAG: helix-turn-helix transcriptional regulator [Candidatus Dadabacteria bacterium]|nr:helix-turn-helix transcriptional regulator [Candidatus Dadabacteria bacterium]